MKMRHFTPATAFTLIELVVTVALSAIVMLALVAAFHETARLQRQHKDLRSATAIAGDLMNEIRSRSFADPQSPTSFGREESPPRANFDDVDDYNSWATSPPPTIEGVTMSNYIGFTERVTVSNVYSANLNSPTGAPPGSTGFKRIVIVVSNSYVAVSNSSVVSQYD